jgi:CheY-like chemotaxis protein
MSKMRFSDKSPLPPDTPSTKDPWQILIADDEGDVHLVTKLVLKDFYFEDRPVELISCYNGAQALEQVKQNPDTAVIILDVVMESYTAGLEVMNHIRHEFANNEVRILLLSGQPGYANVSDIIRQYDINDFIRKESLKHQELRDAVLIALRSYRDIQLAKDCTDYESA